MGLVQLEGAVLYFRELDRRVYENTGMVVRFGGVALRVAGGTLTAYAYNPATLIRVQ